MWLLVKYSLLVVM